MINKKNLIIIILLTFPIKSYSAETSTEAITVQHEGTSLLNSLGNWTKNKVKKVGTTIKTIAKKTSGIATNVKNKVTTYLLLDQLESNKSYSKEFKDKIHQAITNALTQDFSRDNLFKDCFKVKREKINDENWENALVETDKYIDNLNLKNKKITKDKFEKLRGYSNSFTNSIKAICNHTKTQNNLNTQESILKNNRDLVSGELKLINEHLRTLKLRSDEYNAFFILKVLATALEGAYNLALRSLKSIELNKK